MTNKKTHKRGAVLLIAILVASVALAVGMGVYNRVYKELLFGSFWKQTQVAFAAADSGLECAIYRDLNTTAGSCFGVSFAWTPATPVAPAVSAMWSPLNLNVSNGCVKIEVIKYDPAIDDGTGTLINTLIKARGYNDTSCGTNGGRTVERGLGISYFK